MQECVKRCIIININKYVIIICVHTLYIITIILFIQKKEVRMLINAKEPERKQHRGEERIKC